MTGMNDDPGLPEVRAIADHWNLTEDVALLPWQRDGKSVEDRRPLTNAPLRRLTEARWYAENNIPVFPVHTARGGRCSCGNQDCEHPGKHPRTAHGFKDASTDPAQIGKWWTRWPDANIGMPTGTVSGLVVIDIDPRNGGNDSLRDLRLKNGFPETAEQITGGGGRHILFRYPGGPVPKTIAAGIDLKGDGGYIVLAPSIHASGNPYRWDGVRGKAALLNPALAPEWLTNTLAAAPVKMPRNGTPSDSEKWQPGHRNNKLTSLAGTMRRRGMSQESIEAALLEENRGHCDPPLGEAEVREIAAGIAQYPPEAGLPADARSTGVLVTRRMSDIHAIPVCWLWPGRIARGKLTILAGDPGLGKSQISVSIAAIVTTGACWPATDEQAITGNVLFLSAEDDPADTLRPRLEAAGANLTRIHIIDAVVPGHAGAGAQRKRTFSLQDDLVALDKELNVTGNVAAVFIDPISAYLGSADSHKNADIRALLAPLSELAARHNTAIVGISHLSKTERRQVMLRVSGSLAFVAAARAAWVVAPDPDDHERRLFLPLKNNLGQDRSGLAYKIETATVASAAGQIETSRVIWEAEPIAQTADDVMQSSPRRETAALDEAAAWLESELAEGPLAAKEVFARADAEGFSKKTVRRAREKLKVATGKTGMKGGWIWALPPKVPEPTEDARDKSLGTFGDLGHLRHPDNGDRGHEQEKEV